VIILSGSPLRVVVGSHQIIVSLDPYDSDLSNPFSQITNVAINKKHKEWSKVKSWCINHILDIQHYLSPRLPPLSLTKIWEDLYGIITATMLSYKRHRIIEKMKVEGKKVGFMEIVGFDFLVDSEGAVWLLEVNHSPSWFGKIACMLEDADNPLPLLNAIWIASNNSHLRPNQWKREGNRQWREVIEEGEEGEEWYFRTEHPEEILNEHLFPSLPRSDHIALSAIHWLSLPSLPSSHSEL